MIWRFLRKEMKLLQSVADCDLAELGFRKRWCYCVIPIGNDSDQGWDESREQYSVCVGW